MLIGQQVAVLTAISAASSLAGHYFCRAGRCVLALILFATFMVGS
jgi:hypothetical protein